MKTLISPATLATQIEVLLAESKPGRSPLPEMIRLLSEGRHYTWVGIYLSAMSSDSGITEDPGHVSSAQSRSKILVSIRLAGREVGILAVETDKEYGLGTGDRVLLERVASQLARYLTGPGRYLVRRARNDSSGGGAQKSIAIANP